MATLKDQCACGSGPKDAVATVSAVVGGVVSAIDACELPRNEQQVSYLKQRQKKISFPSASANDELSVVMHKAFLEDNCFIREVRTLHEPAIVVALDRQLNDMVRFCTTKENFGVLTVDPTFSLGDFDVTITTYRHLLLQCNRTKNHPSFIGPVMVHHKKTFSTYLFFSSTLVGLRPSLSTLQSFGTDGESALFQAFHHSFPSAIHLLCFNHMQRNLKDKLHEIGIAENIREMIIHDIFGKRIGSHQYEGLVDAVNDKEYESGLDSLGKKWKRFDSCEKGPIQSFIAWFHKYKSEEKKMVCYVPTVKKLDLVTLL